MKKIRVKPKDFEEYDRVRFVTKKLASTNKIESKGTEMMISGCTLDHPSGAFKLWNPTSEYISTSSSVQWSDFKP